VVLIPATLNLIRGHDIILVHEGLELLSYLAEIDNVIVAIGVGLCTGLSNEKILNKEIICYGVCILLTPSNTSNHADKNNPNDSQFEQRAEALVKVGMIEELLNLIVNQVHGDEVYVAAVSTLSKGILVGRSLRKDGGIWEQRILDYVKKDSHRNFLYNEQSSDFCNSVLGDREVVKYIRNKLLVKKEKSKLAKNKMQRYVRLVAFRCCETGSVRLAAFD